MKKTLIMLSALAVCTLSACAIPTDDNSGSNLPNPQFSDAPAASSPSTEKEEDQNEDDGDIPVLEEVTPESSTPAPPATEESTVPVTTEVTPANPE